MLSYSSVALDTPFLPFDTSDASPAICSLSISSTALYLPTAINNGHGGNVPTLGSVTGRFSSGPTRYLFFFFYLLSVYIII